MNRDKIEMKSKSFDRSTEIRIISFFAIVFGAMTIKSAGLVLFTEGEFHQQAGNYLPLIVWFNFIAGFLYIIAGGGLWRFSQWSVWLSFFIVFSTLIAFAVLGASIGMGEAYELRTVIAMAFRTSVWVIISIVAYRKIIRKQSIV